MHWIIRTIALAAIASGALARATAPAPDSLAEFRAAAGAALQADMKSALPHLRRLRVEDLSGERRSTAACMRDRFVAGKAAVVPADLDPWAADVLALYRHYWTKAVLEPKSAPVAERTLARGLALALRPYNGPEDMATLEPLLRARLEAKSLHALFGVTAPLREFMLWRTESERTYDVDLPQGREAVHVVLMDGFVSLGWLGHASCDYRHSGGWATPEKLYAVRSAYDLESEAFRVSYLAHEGQHFADYRRFPGLEQPELEYRAKLVEIALAQSTLYDLLGEFSENGADDRAQAHPWANQQVATRLGGRVLGGTAASAAAWKAIPVAQLNAAARELLDEDSRGQERPAPAAR